MYTSLRDRKCPVCRVSMIRVDATPDGHECYSCPICGGAVQLGPRLASGRQTVSMSSRLVLDAPLVRFRDDAPTSLTLPQLLYRAGPGRISTPGGFNA